MRARVGGGEGREVSTSDPGGQEAHFICQSALPLPSLSRRVVVKRQSTRVLPRQRCGHRPQSFEIYFFHARQILRVNFYLGEKKIIFVVYFFVVVVGVVPSFIYGYTGSNPLEQNF